MSDLPVPLHERAARSLVVSRVCHARYAELLDAQRAALHADDLDLLVRLSAEGVVMLAELEASLWLPAELLETLARTEGPRRDEVEQMLGAVQLEVAGAHAELRRFAAALDARRTVMAAALAGLQPRDPPPVPRTGSGPRPGHPDDSAPRTDPADSTPKALPPPDDTVP